MLDRNFVMTIGGRPVAGTRTMDVRNPATGEVIADHAGAARIEASTVIFDREGAPDFGVVIARTRDGARLMTRVAAQDRVSLDLLLAMDASPVGMDGMVRTGTEGLPHWAA